MTKDGKETIALNGMSNRKFQNALADKASEQDLMRSLPNGKLAAAIKPSTSEKPNPPTGSADSPSKK